MDNNSRFNLRQIAPPVTLNLMIVNVLVWLAEIVLSRQGIDLVDLLGLHYFGASHFRLHQLFSYMFLHDTANINHLFFNMFALWMFGRTIEMVWGRYRYLFFYITCGLSAGLMQELVWWLSMPSGISQHSMELIRVGSVGVITVGQYLNQLVTIGASGSVFGLLLAFGMLFPNTRIYIYFIAPIKAKWFVFIYGAIELFLGISAAGDSVAHFAHLGGMLGGIVLILLWRRKGEIPGAYN